MAKFIEERPPAPNPDEHASFRIGSELLFENDRVRVWELRLAPGERSERHRHQADYLSIFLTRSRLAVHRSDREVESVEEGPGFTAYHSVTGSFVQALENAGSSEHREILVELKGPDALPETESGVNSAPEEP